MGPVGEDSAAPRQGANDPDAGWKGGRPKVRSGFYLDFYRERKDQKRRNHNFGIRNGNFEKNAVVKNQGTKQRVQRILGDCWQWETNGQCVKGDNCGFCHDINKRGKVTQSNTSPNSVM